LTLLLLAVSGCRVHAGEARAVAAAVPIAAATATATAGPTAHPVAHCRQETRERVARAIDDSASYLVRVVDDDGRFAYIVRRDGVVKRPRYNALRHAGTLYAMASAQKHTPNDAQHAAIARATEWMRRELVAPVPGDPAMLAVWSWKEGAVATRAEAKLGGAGLALVALTSAAAAGVIENDAELLTALGRFVIFMQRDDGSFYSKMFPKPGQPPRTARNAQWTSLYYPGEAALGLVMLGEQAANEGAWRRAAEDALLYLATRRAGRGRDVPPDHWALLASERLLRRSDVSTTARAALVAHSVQIAESMIATRESMDPSTQARGDLTGDGRTTPTATRLEGLLAALRSLDPQTHGPLRSRIRKAVDAGVRFLIDAQIGAGPHRGGVPRTVDPNDRRAPEIRIDYVQHALSAWLAYLELLDVECQQLSANVGTTRR